MQVALRPLCAVGIVCVLLVGARAEAAGVRWFEGTVEAAVASAKKSKKRVMVDVYATWRGPCHALDAKIVAREIDRIFGEAPPEAFANTAKAFAAGAGTLEQLEVDDYDAPLFDAPRAAELCDTLAELQFQAGRASDAIASERRALDLKPGEAYYGSRIQKFSPQWQ